MRELVFSLWQIDTILCRIVLLATYILNSIKVLKPYVLLYLCLNIYLRSLVAALCRDDI